MKNLINHLKLIIHSLIIITIFFTAEVNANWQKSENKNMKSSEKMNTENPDEKNSLPEGVTEDWLNDLRDENGNPIKSDKDPNDQVEIPEDPEGDAFQRRIFNGQSAGSQFGFAVSTAGDVNGDGFDDVIIGSPGYSTNTGRFYIYFGGLNMNTVADVTFTGGAAGFYVGMSVSTAGDVNGDGFDDVIIGAPGFSSNTGRAYIHLGSSSMDNVTDLTLTGEATGISFGISVSTAGDVNGDGYSDVIVGAYGYSTGTGRAYIYYGGAALNSVVDVTMTGSAVNNYFGYSVSCAGDFNGDGYSDVIVGAYGYSTLTGRSYIYYGGAVMNNTADVTLTGEITNSAFGNSVSSAGDVNGDGYSDVIAGANRHNTNTGKAYIYFGGSSPDNNSDVIFTGTVANNYFGNSVSTAGDMNGDGFSDIVIGEPISNSNIGKVYIYFGGVAMNNVADAVISGDGVSHYFGCAVSSAGDVNGDGYPEIIAGAYGNATNTGRAYMYDYYMKGVVTHDLSMTGEAADNSFGYTVANAGDVNGDGFSDIIVGAYEYSSLRGRAYIYFGGAIMNNAADVTMTGEPGNSSYGYSVSSAGDVNGDGYSDVIVGARGFSLATGKAYIYFGGSSMDNNSDVTMLGETTFSDFAYSVSSAGDINGDGYSDVIIGSPLYPASFGQGRAYIYKGGASMDNIADVIFTGSSSDVLGYSVSKAGDVNGDGYSDVIVGTGFIEKAFIFYGGVSMNNGIDVTLNSPSAGIDYGKSVSDAGDVNGDGYSDVIVGAKRYSGNSGRAYIYYGGISMNNSINVTLTGESENNYFGYSVSSAGDMNNDGYSDVLVGAKFSSGDGRADVFFGGATMNNVADITVNGEPGVYGFGVSVSFAGDVNGDGYSDIIAGADQSLDSLNGKAYLYTGSAISTKPILQKVKDVPNDQGGYVNLKWVRSSYDVIGNELVTNYLIERSNPPSGGNFYWEQIAAVTAIKNPFYSFTAATPYDSGSNSPGIFYFRITARTSNINQFWRSNALLGSSIDNIAPLMVSPFTAMSAGANVNLNWSSNSAPDLLNYILFRSTSPTIDPYTATPLSTVTTTTYTDTSPLTGLYYYFIVAQDIHGNYSPVASTPSPFFTINLTMLMEGLYRSSLNTQISDTVRADLRNNSSPYALVESTVSFVNFFGSASLKFSKASGGTYYLVIKHRNCIETWSAAGQTVNSGSSMNYNFSTAASLAYGNNMPQIDASPVRFGMYSGDVNQDGTIDLADGSLIDNGIFNFISGYVPTDVNGDNTVDLSDAVFADNNGFNFVSKITP